MNEVTLTFKDAEGSGVKADLKVNGKTQDSEIEFTPAVLFGESVMRCLSSNEGTGLWQLARMFVPEAFENVDELGDMQDNDVDFYKTTGSSLMDS